MNARGPHIYCCQPGPDFDDSLSVQVVAGSLVTRDIPWRHNTATSMFTALQPDRGLERRDIIRAFSDACKCQS